MFNHHKIALPWPWLSTYETIPTEVKCPMTLSILKKVKRFLTYLEIGYQIFKLQPWFRNTRKRLSKSPKIHFVNPGILRAIINTPGIIKRAGIRKRSHRRNLQTNQIVPGRQCTFHSSLLTLYFSLFTFHSSLFLR